MLKWIHVILDKIILDPSPINLENVGDFLREEATDASSEDFYYFHTILALDSITLKQVELTLYSIYQITEEH